LTAAGYRLPASSTSSDEAATATSLSTAAVTVVKQNPAAYLDQPKVAAYVAQLDSICAAAQARVSDEIQAIPQANQPGVIEARDRIMRETISELRRSSVPEAFAGPTWDECSRSWRSFTTMRSSTEMPSRRTTNSHRNRWPARSSRPQASTSASFRSDWRQVRPRRGIPMSARLAESRCRRWAGRSDSNGAPRRSGSMTIDC
jgi:hypothetical protein